jgi:hypothetical protein
VGKRRQDEKYRANDDREHAYIEESRAGYMEVTNHRKRDVRRVSRQEWISNGDSA